MHEGVEGLLRDKTRPSRVPPLGREIADRVVALTLSAPRHEATHWTAPAMAKTVGISVSAVQRIWRAHGLQPHRVRQFKLSRDPEFIPKLRDIVGLYVDPPAHAVVLSVDEKSQIQALDRTQPGLPMKTGRAGTMTHDYKRHGTTHAVRRAERARRACHRPVHAAPSTPRVHSLPQRHRSRRARGKAGPCDPRQLRRPQASQGPRVAYAPSALFLPLHPNILLPGSTPSKVSSQSSQSNVSSAASSTRSSISRPPSTASSNTPTNDPQPFIWTKDPDKIIAAVRRGHQALDSIH